MKLTFYDFHRQRYAGLVQDPETTGDFMIGDHYDNGDGVGKGGEFKILLHDFSAVTHNAGGRLEPQVCVFTDGYGALNEAIKRGLLDKLRRRKLRTRGDLTRLLTDLGMEDVSDNPC